MRTIVILSLTLGWLASAQGVLDKLKQKVDQLNKAGQAQQQKQSQPRPQPSAQPNSSPRPENSASSPSVAPMGDVATLAAGAGFVDVAGIKPGMTVKDTMLALRAVNPNLTITPDTFRLEGFGSQDLLDTVNAYSLSGQEQITLAFTVPPGPEVLWGLTRQLRFNENERPVSSKVLSELQKKYGPESGVFGRLHVWTFNARGARQTVNPTYFMLGNCNALVAGIQADISNGYNKRAYGPTGKENDCEGMTVVTADVDTVPQDRQGRQIIPAEQPVQILTMTMESLPLHRATAEAARAVALGAQQQKQDAKNAQELKNRSVPKL
jgi:hypothetical protein